MRDDHVVGDGDREPVVDLLPLETREHAIGGGGRDELLLREEGEELSDGSWGRDVVLAVVEGDVEVGHARLRERDVDVRAAEKMPERSCGAVV